MRRLDARLYLFHPVLFALLPVLSLLAHNINVAPPLHALRPGVIALLLTAAVLILARRLAGDWEQASLLTSLFVMLFFSYGHVYLGQVTAGTIGLFQTAGLVGRHLTLLVAWGCILALGSLAIHRAKALRPVMTRMFFAMGLAASAFPVVGILSHEVLLRKPWDWAPGEILVGTATAPASPPDIYLIVLDGHGRSDVLQAIYDYDSSPFIDGLQERGFFVASQARSNYIQTGLSLASTLNLTYLDFLSKQPGEASSDRTPVARLIRQSRLRALLEDSGYRIIGLSTGFRVTELEDADLYLRTPIGAVTEFERMLTETSGGFILQDLPTALGFAPFLPGYQAHRERILHSIETLQSVASLPGPKFVLAHLLVPHPPFVFDQTGGETSWRYPFSLMEGNMFMGTHEEYIQGYRDQITYVDHVMLDVLSSILATSPSPPIIVLMGDHGPGSRLAWDSVERTDLLERTGILNAYFLPGASQELLYEGITPVNSFRLILDAYFGTELGLLPDRSYFSTWMQPYSFIPIDG